ncbi:hypothetical protein D9619_011434 [Psilocybe cf. subviscida]|uniref:Uncharacterized protein n=1 Tax=Psilocybe cf. subviscida TaxID=2480587 RepID=A0A8H5BSJ8_9AGAR|nr:hypothetical protein D9619_011434 [Psilocybe cf. subviscida]
MASPSLPLDMLSTIVEIGSFSRNELCIISSASPHLRYEAQHRLFRDPGRQVINVVADPNKLVTARLFLQAIISSPDRLALMVRQYHVRALWYNFAGKEKKKTLEKQRKMQIIVFNRLSRGLPLMRNLTVLQLYTDRSVWTRYKPVRPPSISSILKRCTFRLEVLRWSYRDDTGLKDREIVKHILCNQQDLKELWVDEIRRPRVRSNIAEPRDIFQNICPSVVSVGGMPGIIIGMLLEGRRLQHICWEGSWFEQDYDLPQTAHFRSVEFVENLAGGPSLRVICAAFRNLVLLKTGRTEVLEV